MVVYVYAWDKRGEKRGEKRRGERVVCVLGSINHTYIPDMY